MHAKVEHYLRAIRKKYNLHPPPVARSFGGQILLLSSRDFFTPKNARRPKRLGNTAVEQQHGLGLMLILRKKFFYEKLRLGLGFDFVGLGF